MLLDMTQTRLVFLYHDLVYRVKLSIIMPNLKIFAFSVKSLLFHRYNWIYAIVTTRDLSNLPKNEVEGDLRIWRCNIHPRLSLGWDGISTYDVLVVT
jgi:hypothetical protein